MAHLIVPGLAAAALLVCSNHNKKKKEGYENINNSTDTAYPQIRPIAPSVNYPTQSPVDTSLNTQVYANPNSATDKYFNQDIFEKRVEEHKPVDNTIQQLSLTGAPMDEISSSQKSFLNGKGDPFFGAKVRGRGADLGQAQSILDNMNGSGSQMITKEERAPLFAPQNNLQWANGAPNVSDFYQSRVNPATNISNVKPWDSEQVGPGLNQGYTTAPSGGFNSGMESRQTWEPKTVNELRVATNPKLTFGLENHQGPAVSKVGNMGIQGKVEKYLPDAYFINTPDRWLTTTGAEKGETQRPEVRPTDNSRAVLNCSYDGAMQGNPQSYIDGEYEDSKRNELEQCNIPSAYNSSIRGNNLTTIQDGYNLNTNQRNISNAQQTSFISNVKSTVSAIVAPILDILKPSRKENVIGNLRLNGDVGTTVPASYVINPADRTATTIRETTKQQSNLNIQGVLEGGYLVNNQQQIYNQRDTTNCPYTGISGGGMAQAGDASHLSSNNQTYNANRTSTLTTHANNGGTQIFNGSVNMHCRSDCDRDSNRSLIPTMRNNIPSIQTYGQVDLPPVLDTGKMEETRMDPTLLNAFRNNPYTQSLSSI